MKSCFFSTSCVIDKDLPNGHVILLQATAPSLITGLCEHNININFNERQLYMLSKTIKTSF